MATTYDVLHKPIHFPILGLTMPTTNTKSVKSANYLKAERKAQEVLSEYQTFFGNNEYFTPLKEIIEAEGICLRVIPMADKIADISGFYQPKTRTIYVNANDPVGRQRFTAAHEFGHYCLNHKTSQYDVLLRGSLFYTEREKPLEQEANMFAAELLVPKVKLEKILQMTRDTNQIAQIFGVSPEVVLYRRKYIARG